MVADQAACLVLAIAGSGVALNSAELLVASRDRQSFAALAWSLPAAASALFAVRLCAAALTAVQAARGADYLLPLLVTTAASLFVARWKSVGADGADQMSSLILVTMSITSLAGRGGVNASSVGLHFLSAQLLMAYFAAGVAKASCGQWRGEDVLLRIFGTRTYGERRCFHMMSRCPRMSAGLRWAIITFEIAAPLLLLVPYEYVPALLALGLAFHVACAIVMGLNDFVWAFVAVYPACIFSVQAYQT